MRITFPKSRPLVFCSILSVLLHALFIFSLRMMGSYQFALPVNNPLAVMVDLAGVPTAVGAEMPQKAAKGNEPEAPEAAPVPQDRTEVKPLSEAEPVQAKAEPKPEPDAEPAPEPKPVAEAGKPILPPETREERKMNEHRPIPKPHKSVVADGAPTMLKTVSDFLGSKYEKLTYLVSMYGIPIGNAELESKNENGVTVISLSVKSNAVFSNYFPVDNLIETRHINGMFVVSRVRQNEGSFKNDQSFTINVPRKKVSCFDFNKSKTLTMEVPSGDVLDSLSGIYYLRNRQLEVGRTETLHIFDSETYADVPVEVLRKEPMRLPNLTMVDTVVIRPLQKTPGIFRRTGDVLIWMTDDAMKVPVRITTSIAIGRVTAELISSESEPRTKTADQARAFH